MHLSDSTPISLEHPRSSQIDPQQTSFTIMTQVPLLLRCLVTPNMPATLAPGTYPANRIYRPDGDWIVTRIDNALVGLPREIWELFNDPVGTRCEDRMIRVF